MLIPLPPSGVTIATAAAASEEAHAANTTDVAVCPGLTAGNIMVTRLGERERGAVEVDTSYIRTNLAVRNSGLPLYQLLLKKLAVYIHPNLCDSRTIFKGKERPPRASIMIGGWSALIAAAEKIGICYPC